MDCALLPEHHALPAHDQSDHQQKAISDQSRLRCVLRQVCQLYNGASDASQPLNAHIVNAGKVPTCPRLTISAFFSFFMANTLPLVFCLHSLTCNSRKAWWMYAECILDDALYITMHKTGEMMACKIIYLSKSSTTNDSKQLEVSC